MARLSDSITYGNHAVTGDVDVGGTLTVNGDLLCDQVIYPDRETISVTAGQTVINLTTLVLVTDRPTITVDGYTSQDVIYNYTVNTPTKITLSNPIENNGQLTVTQYLVTPFKI